MDYIPPGLRPAAIPAFRQRRGRILGGMYSEECKNMSVNECLHSEDGCSDLAGGQTNFLAEIGTKLSVEHIVWARMLILSGMNSWGKADVHAQKFWISVTFVHISNHFCAQISPLIFDRNF